MKLLVVMAAAALAGCEPHTQRGPYEIGRVGPCTLWTVEVRYERDLHVVTCPDGRGTVKQDIPSGKTTEPRVIETVPVPPEPACEQVFDRALNASVLRCRP